MDKCEKIIIYKGWKNSGKRRCERVATVTAEDGRHLCGHHYKKWSKKVNKEIMENPTSPTPEQIEEEIREELKEAAHYFGGRPDGFKKLREMINEIEESENEAAWERYTSKS